MDTLGNNVIANNQAAGRIRWIIPVVLMITVFIGYLDRQVISIALPKIAETYGWTKAQTGAYGGNIMSIFYVAYGLANIFFSPIGERFGARKSMLVVVILWSLFTALGGVFGLMFTAFIITRVMLGLSEGIHFPMMNLLTKEWFPMSERSRGNGIYVVGIFIAGILAPIMIVPLVAAFGWRWMFVILGCIGMGISFPLIWKFIFDTPRKHPSITQDEVDYIEDGMEKDQEIIEGSLWKQIRPFVISLPFWVVLLGGIMNNAIAQGLLSWLPAYFTQERGLPFKDLWYAVSLPFLFSILGVLVWAYFGDKTNRRALIAAIGFIFTAFIAYFAVTAATIFLTVILFSITIFINMTYPSNEYAIVQRIFPKNRVGTGVGLYNGLAMMIGGGLGPVIIGTVVSATGSYTSGLLTLAALCFVAALVMFAVHKVVRY